jgi:hypothetical protein
MAELRRTLPAFARPVAIVLSTVAAPVDIVSQEQLESLASTLSPERLRRARAWIREVPTTTVRFMAWPENDVDGFFQTDEARTMGFAII